MKTTIKLFSLLLCLSLISCEEKDLEGQYKVTEIKGMDVTGEGATIIINNEDGWRISGNNSCNTYGGDITYDGSNYIKVGPVMATKMFCQEKRDIERSFMNQLAEVASYRFSQGHLILLNESGEEIIKAERTENLKEK
ncbi:MAG: META domain-containing protein [Nonlabens sp.]